MSSGFHHNVLLFEDEFKSENQELFVFGRNVEGQLGFGAQDFISEPTHLEIKTKQKIKSICCGPFHTLISTENELWGFGKSTDFQLGIGEIRQNVLTPVKILETKRKIKSIGCGWSHSVIVVE